jgi:hypothetical protein
MAYEIFGKVPRKPELQLWVTAYPTQLCLPPNSGNSFCCALNTGNIRPITQRNAKNEKHELRLFWAKE